MLAHRLGSSRNRARGKGFNPPMSDSGSVAAMTRMTATTIRRQANQNQRNIFQKIERGVFQRLFIGLTIEACLSVQISYSSDALNSFRSTRIRPQLLSQAAYQIVDTPIERR